MTDKKSLLGAGNVTVTLGNKDDGTAVEYVLKPTPLAIKTLSASCQGLGNCLAQIRSYEFNLMMQVIVIGAGLKGQKAVARLEEQMCMTPLPQVMNDLHRFIMVLMNGGRAIDLDDAADDDGDEVDEGNE